MDDAAHEASQPSDTTAAVKFKASQTGSDDLDTEKVAQTLQEQLQHLDSYTDESQLLAALVAIRKVLLDLPGLTEADNRRTVLAQS